MRSMRKLTAHGFGALPDFSLCQNLLGSEIYSFVCSRHLWLLHCKRMQRTLSFSTPWHWTYTQTTTGHNWMKPVSVATCAHAFMMIWPLAKDPAKDLNDDRVNFRHGHHGPVTLKCVTTVFQIIFSTAWHLAHRRSKREKVRFPGKRWDPRSELPNNQNPKSEPKNWIKPRSAVVIGSADPLKFRSESTIRAKILTKSADP